MIINLIYILYVNEWFIFIQNEPGIVSKSLSRKEQKSARKWVLDGFE